MKAAILLLLLAIVSCTMANTIPELELDGKGEKKEYKLNNDIIDLQNLCRDEESDFCDDIGGVSRPTSKGGKGLGPQYIGYEKCADIMYLARCRQTCNVVTGGCDRCEDLIDCSAILPSGKLDRACEENKLAKSICPRTCGECTKGRLDVLEEAAGMAPFGATPKGSQETLDQLLDQGLPLSDISLKGDLYTY